MTHCELTVLLRSGYVLIAAPETSSSGQRLQQAHLLVDLTYIYEYSVTPFT